MLKPILFSTEMVRAILDGRKTMTRRVVKPQNIFECGCEKGYIFDGADQIFRCKTCGDWVKNHDRKTSFEPKYAPGDVLWVRETWNYKPQNIQINEKGDVLCSFPEADEYVYKATPPPFPLMPWRPSIHMPREAARIFLEVIDVRVERLQDITEEQAKKEGADRCIEVIHPEDGNVIYQDQNGYYCIGFKSIWNPTIKEKNLEQYGWDANPWAWVYEFERCENA